MLTSAAFLAMARHMTSHHLEAADMPPGVVTDTSWQSGALILGFGLSIPVFFITTSAWVLWFVIPLLAAQVGRLQRRKQRRRPGHLTRTGGAVAGARSGTFPSNARM